MISFVQVHWHPSHADLVQPTSFSAPLSAGQSRQSRRFELVYGEGTGLGAGLGVVLSSF